MAWHQLHVQCTKDNVEIAETLLLEAESLSITIEDAGDQPLFEPLPGQSPLWDSVVMTGLFAVDDSLNSHQQLEILAQDIASQADASRVWMTFLDDTDWERVWMSHYHPIECANNLWIVPKWLEPPKADATNIIMDPGLAFGTGYHATTRLCLDWLTEQNLSDKIVIDYGCGSGILGVAALLLGAKTVYAVDIDPQAVLATKQNAKRNGVQKQLSAYLPDEFQKALEGGLIQQGHLLIANILAKPLISLAPYFSTLCQPQAQFVLSGLIEEQLDEVEQAYTTPFKVEHRYAFAKTEDAHWYRLSGIFTG